MKNPISRTNNDRIVTVASGTKIMRKAAEKGGDGNYSLELTGVLPRKVRFVLFAGRRFTTLVYYGFILLITVYCINEGSQIT